MEVQRIGDEFIARDQDLEFLIRGIKETNDGLSAVVRSFYLNGSKMSITAPTRINFYSGQGRNTLAKALTSGRSVPGMDARAWEVVTVNLCGKVSEAWEEGEPFVNLGQQPEPSLESRFAFKDFVPAGESSVWVADGGSGKSTIGAALLLSYATGIEIIPGVIPAEQAPCMILDWESNQSEHLRRLYSIARAYGMTIPETLLYRRNYRAFAEDISHFRREIARFGVRFLLIDSVVPASDLEIKDTAAPTRLFNAAASLGETVTRLFLAHMTKEQASAANGRARVMGSVMYDNLARSVWELRKSETSPARGEMTTGFFHTKINGGGYEDPFALKIHYDAMTRQPTRFERVDVRSIADLRERLPVRDRLADLLRQGSRTTTEIAAELGVTPGAAVKYLKRRDGIIEIVRGGGKGKPSLWGLSAEPPPNNPEATNEQSDDEWWQ
jgi:hypothetical protein